MMMNKLYMYYTNHGFLSTAIKIKEFFITRCSKNSKKYVYRELPNNILIKQKNFPFKEKPLISVVVPVYNVRETFLRDMIESVLKQTYNKWELCIANASTDENIQKILLEYCRTNCRIKIIKIGNQGIAANTNVAISLSNGCYIAFLDHDDFIPPQALFEVVKAINDKNEPDFIYTDEDYTDSYGKTFFLPHFKPDFSIDLLRSYNYICHFSIVRKNLLDKIGKLDSRFDGSQDYDLILRIVEQAKNIVHIPQILYHWRMHSRSVSSGAVKKGNKKNAHQVGKIALREHLKRMQLKADVEDGIDGTFDNIYKVNFALNNNPKISIIIPNSNHKSDLERCINSLLKKTTYKNYEIIIADNNSTHKDIEQYYKNICDNKNVNIIYWKHEFNYSKINNWAVNFAKGQYIVFMNNDIKIISDNWIENMLMYAQRNDVGAVGAKLYYADGRIQHGGIIIGIGGVAGHAHKYFSHKSTGYFKRLSVVQNMSAVTGALLMIAKKKLLKIGGFDETLAIAFNDVDLCLKLRKSNYLIVFNPYVEAYHYESKSRGLEDTTEKQKRFSSEIQIFHKKWGNYEDPYYNVNLTLNREDFGLK